MEGLSVEFCGQTYLTPRNLLDGRRNRLGIDLDGYGVYLKDSLAKGNKELSTRI